MSFLKLHYLNTRATPEQFCVYTLSLLLHILYNNKTPTNEWVSINFNLRERNFKAFNILNYKVGKTNKFASRLMNLNNLIPLEWLNKNKIEYKLLCKRKLLLCNDTSLAYEWFGFWSFGTLRLNWNGSDFDCSVYPKSERFGHRTIIKRPKSKRVQISDVDCI